jgi:hypothetical protein
MELRGADGQLTVVLHFDDWVFRPSGADWLPGNMISLQVRAKTVERKRAASWI